MAKMRYSFESKYPLITYGDVLKTYSWLKGCFDYVFSDFEDLIITESFEFTSQGIDYDCNSIEEFKEHAFGRNIHPVTFFIMAKSRGGTLAHFWGRNNPGQAFSLDLTSEDKQAIIAIQEYLLLNEAEILKLHSDRSVQKKNYIIQNTANTAEVKEDEIFSHKSSIKPQSAKKPEQWYSRLLWKLVIPIAVIIIAAAICLWLGL